MLRAIRAEFREVLAAALRETDFDADALAIEEPPEDVEAVVASSVAFRLAHAAGASPPEVAARIAAAIDVTDTTYLESVTQAGPYINAHPSPAYYRDTVDAARTDDYGQLADRDTSIVVEHTSANPTGPVHVGRARNPIIGDSLARLLDAAGYDVEVHYYVNDVGRQMALFTWAYETFDEDELPEPERDRIEYDLVRYYRKGNAYLESADPEETAEIEAEIASIMQGLEAGDPQAYDRVGEVVDQVLSGMQACLARLPAEFDRFVKESRFMRNGDTTDVVERLQATEAAEQAEGAWQLDLAAFDIDKEFVFVRSDGTTLYTTRDIAHHEWKFDKFDRAVTVLGEEQELHARQLRAALDLLGNETDKLENVFYGWVTLPGGEGMSTRKGTGIDLDDLLDEAISRARSEIEHRRTDASRHEPLSEEELQETARQIGIGAVRYDIVSTQPSKAITFEWERALDFEGQSAPYVQYVHARCCGILDRAETEPASNPGPFEHPSERMLLDRLAAYEYELEQAALDRTPHRMAGYLQDLADDFNAFYRDCPVLDADADTRATRLALVDASRRTVAGGLALLGIGAPTSM